MVRGSISPEEACSAVGGTFKKRTRSCSVSLKDPEDVCNLLGGNYDFDEGSEKCDLPITDPRQPKEILNRGSTAFFFVLQLIAGVTSTVVNIWYAPTTLPPIWWTSYPILAGAFVLNLLVNRLKLRSWTEAIIRSLVALVTIAVLSVIIGWTYYWDATLYWGIIGFADLPIAGTIYGMIISALLSFVLVQPNERADDKEGNEFDNSGVALTIL